MYYLVYRKQASKALARMPKWVGMRFLSAFEKFAENPFEGTHCDVCKLSGRTGYRLRIGSWRALYCIRKDKRVIEVLRIDVRGGVYK